MKKTLVAIALITAGVSAGAAVAATYHGHELANQAKVQLAEAQKIALKARPGR